MRFAIGCAVALLLPVAIARSEGVALFAVLTFVPVLLARALQQRSARDSWSSSWSCSSTPPAPGPRRPSACPTSGPGGRPRSREPHEPGTGTACWDFERFRTRFGRDVAAMNRIALEDTGHPLLALVLHQYLRLDSPGHRMMQAAEEALASAGARVVPTGDYVRRYDGRAFAVSRFEGHPSVEGHRIFAEMLLPPIRAAIPDTFRRVDPAPLN